MTTTRKEGWESASGSNQVDSRQMEHVYKEQRKTEWESHPLNGNVKLAYHLTKKNDGVKVTCLLARVPKGESIPEHTHKVYDVEEDLVIYDVFSDAIL